MNKFVAILPIFIFIALFGFIALVIYLITADFNDDKNNKELGFFSNDEISLNEISLNEVSFLKEQGYIDKHIKDKDKIDRLA